jgi:hypothetical protein
MDSPSLCYDRTKWHGDSPISQHPTILARTLGSIIDSEPFL